MESTNEAAPLSAPMTIDAWLSAADGDASGLWFDSLLADLSFPQAFVWGEMAAFSKSDTRAVERYYSSPTRPFIGSASNDFLYGRGELMRAWPANPTENDYTRVRDSAVPTLLVSGELDFAIPPQAATRSCCRTCRTATRSSSAASATRPRSGTSSPRQVNGS